MLTDHQAAEWVVEQWRTICSQAPSHMAVFDRESRFIAASERWIADYEGGRREILGRPYYDVNPDAPDRWRDIHRRALAGETCREDSERFRLDDGREFWSRWVCSPWLRPDGSVGGFVVHIENITPQLLYQRHLSVAEQELHLALESARAGTWEVDLRTFASKWSPETWGLYGLEPNQVQPSFATWAETIVPEHRERISNLAGEALARHAEIELEWRVNLPDEERWLLARGRPVIEHDGSIERYIGVVIDVTAKKQLELVSAQQAHELKLILDALPVGVARVDRQLRYRFANQLYGVRYHCDPAEIIGKRVADVIGEDALSRAMPTIDAVLAGESRSFDNQLRFADGKIHHVRVTFVPDITPSGVQSGFYAMSSDMTDVREREAEIMRMRDRLDELTYQQVAQQTLVAVVHELRQPLHAAAVFAEVACRACGTAKNLNDAKHAMVRSSEEIARASHSLSQLFDSIRKSTQAKDGGAVLLDLGELLSSTLSQYRGQQRDGGGCLHVTPCQDLLPVIGNPTALEKIIINLVRNAIEAHGCGDQRTPGCQVRVTASVVADQACIAVEDNAGGVAPAIRPHLFEPFQTAKANGLGIGLSICKQLAEQHHGTIWHEDRPGGSAFLLSIPLAR